MGVLRLMRTLLQHPATKDAFIENVPVFQCLLVDYNANIHYILQKTITELNEILYFTYQSQENIKKMLLPRHLVTEPTEYQFDMELSLEDVKNLAETYHEEYQIGTTYEEVRQKLSSEEKIIDIIFKQTIKYTRMLICSLNKGWIKKVFISLDGTPSMAKIKEQKNRRYIGAYLHQLKEKIVHHHKFQNIDIMQIDLFYYRSMICAGTKFFEKIQEALFHLDINLDVEISTIQIKGEGEKKIIHAINEYNDYEGYCIMSPDSDMLILIGLLSHNTKFLHKKLYNFRIDYQHNHQYQFFDLKQLVLNFQNYYAHKLNLNITIDKMLDVFFMLVVFGNDFLPKLEPLDIIQHFDFVCETCLKLSASGVAFIQDKNLNYQYLLEFFKLINQNMIPIAIEKYLGDQYNNYQKLCQQISISSSDLEHNYHHPSIKVLPVNYHNLMNQINVLCSAYRKFMDFIKKTTVQPIDLDFRRGNEGVHDAGDLKFLYRDIHANSDDSYFLLVLPRILRFPDHPATADCYQFFCHLVNYLMTTRDYKSLKFRIRLMPRAYYLPTISQDNALSSYLAEIEKMNRSLEPYRSLLHMRHINLVSYNLQTKQWIDLREKYYENYVKPKMTPTEIENLVVDYLVGIEWLYQYYIMGQHLEWSGWCYRQTQPPLIDDLIKYLEKDYQIQKNLSFILNSYPENNMSPLEHYLHVTPNNYTQANVSPNIEDVLHLIDGNGAAFLNKCQIKWHDYKS